MHFNVMIFDNLLRFGRFKITTGEGALETARHVAQVHMVDQLECFLKRGRTSISTTLPTFDVRMGGTSMFENLRSKEGK